RVPVAVTPDPGFPRQEGMGPRRASSRSAGVARLRGLLHDLIRVPVRECLRAGGPERAAPAGPGAARVGPLVERRVGLAIDPRDDAEQGLVEEGERRPDLVERRHGAGSQIGGPPQEGDLLAEAAPRVAILVGDDLAIREPAEETLDAAERDQDRPAAGLGRMRGQDRADPEASELGFDRGVAETRSAEPLDGRAERIVGRPTAGRRGAPAGGALTCPVGPTSLANQLALLGQVHEPEIEAERTHDDLGPLRSERRQLGYEAGPERWVIAAPEANRRPPDPFDEVEQLAAGLLGNHLAEERSEQADLEPERIARPAGPDRRRLGTDGLVGFDA